MEVAEYKHRGEQIAANWYCGGCNTIHTLTGFFSEGQWSMFERPKIMKCNECRTTVCVQFTPKGLIIWR